MWHHQLHTPHDVFYAFVDGLTDESLQKRINDNTKFAGWGNPCLLDIIGTWLGFEDNILSVPSYDIFMVSVVLIIEGWLEGERKTVDMNPLWLDPTTREPHAVQNLLPKDHGGTYYEHDLQIGIAHELFNRSAFDADRAIAQQSKLDKIHNNLERLLPREPN